MGKFLLSVLGLLVIFYSCKKGNDGPGQPDPVKVPDTAYLAKSEILYSYNVAGTGQTDSTIFKWTYDAQRRPVTRTARFLSGELDSFSYSYTASQDIIAEVVSDNPAFQLVNKTAIFHQASGRVDSTHYNTAITSISFGLPYTTEYASVTYNNYDIAGNDVLDSSYNLLPSKHLSGIIQRTFINNSLTTLIQYDNGSKTLSDTYEAGNLISDTTYDIVGAVESVSSYTYSSTSSGGFVFYSGSGNLRASTTYTSQNYGSQSQTLSYTFDSSNRVSTVSYSSFGNVGSKEVYTY